MKQYSVEGCERKTLYPLLVRFIGAYSTHFSLVYFRYKEEERVRFSVKQIQKKLQPYMVSSVRTNNMPSMITMNDNNHIYEFTLYKSTQETGRILETVHSLWSWDYPKYPMDLCFYRNGYAWFVSSAHEKDCYLYAGKEDKMLDDLESLGFRLTPCGEVEQASLFSIQGQEAVPCPIERIARSN